MNISDTSPSIARAKAENAVFEYYQSLPDPKPSFTHWWYRDGGIKDLLDEAEGRRDDD